MKWRITILFFIIISFTSKINAQYILSGIVYDSSMQYGVENVKIIVSNDNYVYSDSLGKYKIPVAENDSVYFYFLNKPTPKFAVNTIPDITQFNVRMHINYKSRYKLLKEVTVFSKPFKEKIAENRETYAKVFNYEKPGLQTNSNGSLDFDALVNVFRFRHNKTMRWFRNRLVTEEQEKFIDNRFNKYAVKRITQLDGKMLDSFMIEYRPNYELVTTANEITFNQYVLACYYKFKMDIMKPKDAMKKQ